MPQGTAELRGGAGASKEAVMKKLVVGVIPDGVRTWWSLHQSSGDLYAAYRKAAREGAKIVEGAPEMGVERVVFYAMSQWDVLRRSEEQVRAMRGGITEFCRMMKTRPHVEVNAYGDFQLMSLELLVQKSCGPSMLTVDLLVGYSAEWDLQDRPVRTAPIPEVDVVVRTKGRHSLSGFLPLQANYAELYVYQGLWPSSGYRAFRSAVSRCKEHQAEVSRSGGRGA